MSIASAFACGKFIAVIYPILILALPRFLLQLLDRYVCLRLSLCHWWSRSACFPLLSLELLKEISISYIVQSSSWIWKLLKMSSCLLLEFECMFHVTWCLNMYIHEIFGVYADKCFMCSSQSFLPVSTILLIFNLRVFIWMCFWVSLHSGLQYLSQLGISSILSLCKWGLFNCMFKHFR